MPALGSSRQVHLGYLIGIDIKRLGDYPHQFSGGMRQRVAIAMALALEPRIVIADEPVTALDVIVQRQILDVLCDLRERLGISIILITHDIGVVAYACDRVAVMYAGKVVETGSVSEIVESPCHPYTIGLANAFPRLEGDLREVVSIPGDPPDLRAPPAGCRFAVRCPFAMPACGQYDGPQSDQHTRVVACLRAAEATTLRVRAQDPRTWIPAS